MTEQNGLPANSKKVFKEILETLMNEDGFVKSKDIPIAFNAIGYDVTEKDIEPILLMFDTNNDKKLHIDEILDNLEMLNINSGNKQSRLDIINAFSMFDRLDDKSMREHEFLQVMTADVSDNKISREEAVELWKEVLNKFDTSGDGRLNYDDFVRYWYEEILQS